MTFKKKVRLDIPALLLGLLVLVACQPSSSHSAKNDIPQSPTAQPANPELASSPNGSLRSLAEVDRLVKGTLQKNGPGIAILVLRNNQVIHAKGYGLADIKQQRSITPETNFDLASVSKQVTALCILKLVQSGQIDLDAPVKQYLPKWRDRKQPVTISHLLNHTSGLADYSGQDWDGTDEEFAQLDLEQHFTWLNRQRPHRAPGKKFEYNNSGYALLALIVQRVAKKPFWQFAKDEIFAPIGMSKTEVLHQAKQKISDAALGYKVGENGQVRRSESASVIQGDGNVFSSIADLAQYDIALRTNRLIPSALKVQAFTSGKLDNGRTIQSEGEGYGFGWYVTDDYVHHSGSWYGTSTYYRHYLEQPVTIILLSNDENYEVSDLADKIANSLNLSKL